MRIYVSVGTHEQPFQRLLDSVALLVGSPDDEWLVQHGMGAWATDAPGVRAVDYLTAHEVSETLTWADVMVSQASPGNAFGALDAGVWPIVLGRQKRFGEHVDDHQVRFARALAEMGLATELRDVAELASALETERRREPADRRTAIAEANAASRARRRHFGTEAWPLILGDRA